jgi:hypothetical protein
LDLVHPCSALTIHQGANGKKKKKVQTTCLSFTPIGLSEGRMNMGMKKGKERKESAAPLSPPPPPTITAGTSKFQLSKQRT